MSRIVVIGEAMLELSGQLGGEARLAYGGDTLNTAIYMARCGQKPDFITALGKDEFSDELLSEWQAEDVGTDHILRHESKVPGLYAIRTDEKGERHFYYWRENSAARSLFETTGHEAAIEHAERADWLYLSGITLSIFSDKDRQKLYRITSAVKARGGQVVFDPNYRARGWSSAGIARQAMRDLAPTFTIVLPTFEDDQALFEDQDPDKDAARWMDWGAKQVVVKLGPQGCIIYDGDRRTPIPVEHVIQPIDTTGAGDSFNGAFLGHLIGGMPIEIAAVAGSRLAGTVIQHPGAIVLKADMPDLSLSALQAAHTALLTASRS